MALQHSWTLACLVAAAALATPITNNPADSDTAEFTQVNQYQPYSQQVTRERGANQQVARSVLSPQQQTNILSDVHQHRFQIAVPPAERPSGHGFQQPRQNGGFQPFTGQRQYSPPQQVENFNPQPAHPQFTQATFHHSSAAKQPAQYQQPAYSQPQTSFQQPQLNFQPQTYQQQPNYQLPPRVEESRYQSEFRAQQYDTNNYVAPENQQSFEKQNNKPPQNYRYLSEVAQQKPQVGFTPQQKPPVDFPPQQKPLIDFPPQQNPQVGFVPQQKPQVPYVPQQKPQVPYVPQQKPQVAFDPQQKPQVAYAPQPSYNPLPPLTTELPPSYILETQPPTTNRKQKPYEAITFSAEGYVPTTPTPPPTSRAVKHRRPAVKHEEAKKQASRTEKNPELYIKSDRQKLYQQIASTQQPSKRPGRVRSTRTSTTTPRPTTATKSDEELIQEELQRQLQEQLLDKDNPFGTLKLTLPGSLTPEQIANLPQIAGLGDATFSQESPATSIGGGQNIRLVEAPKGVSLGGEKKGPEIRIVHRTAPLAPTTTVQPPEVLFEELTKGVLPPGADFELIRQKQDGELEEVSQLKGIPQKKVTFVILEEQPDGSVKVQGVRGNNPVNDTPDVDSIIDKIKTGEIKLPPSASSTPAPRTVTPEESVPSPSYIKHTDKAVPYKISTPSPKITNAVYDTLKRKQGYVTESPPVTANSHAGPVFALAGAETTTTAAPEPQRRAERVRVRAPSFLPTVPSEQDLREYYRAPPRSSPATSTTASTTTTTTSTTTTPPPRYEIPDTAPAYLNHRDHPPNLPLIQPLELTTLNEIFKSKGLYAMAKFLRQSGLDRILNETGPYTIFVPTDRAFRSLLVQLGGPDRAEQKFRQNPRLLSGLLLHHVIPGAFKLEGLQDEMTGVSLAGTQLRVNTYTTQDQEWNDLKVVTINGARVLSEMSDIEVPQGVAHAVDRVMFPLPVGDILMTLQADREARFTKFIKLLQETGVSSMLQGTKTYTVFAPTNEAFNGGEEEKLLEQRAAARALVLRHLTPGTLYSAGMHYYQLRDTMNSGKQITLLKEAGRVKVNNAQVVTRNIPATNGVIHAVDSFL